MVLCAYHGSMRQLIREEYSSKIGRNGHGKPYDEA